MIHEETIRLVKERSAGHCECSWECDEEATDIHHMLSKSNINKAKFPLFLNSIFNLKHINNGCHLNKTIPKIREREAWLCEQWLRGFLKGEIT